MPFRKYAVFFLLLFLCLGFSAYASTFQEPIAGQSVSQQASDEWDAGWYHGAEGYAQALEEYEKTNKPMAIYANVTWCPYCRTFESRVLSNPKVKAYMQEKGIIRVHLNPEDGAKENAIAFQYGVMGFPSFYVHPPQPSGTIRLMTGVSPEQFIELFEKILK